MKEEDEDEDRREREEGKKKKGGKEGMDALRLSGLFLRQTRFLLGILQYQIRICEQTPF